MTAKSTRPEPPVNPNETEERPGRSTRRFWVVAAVLVGFALVMISQLFRWQVAEHSQMVALAEAQNANSGREQVRLRGRIMDAKQNVLAVDIFEYSLYASKPETTAGGTLDEDCARIAPIIGLSAAEIKDTLEKGGEYQLVATHIPQERREVYDALDPQPIGFHLDITPKRMYPAGPLASHVLGFVNAVHQGYYGLEQYYDAKLVGEVPSIPANVMDDPILALCNPVETKPGQEMILTIDRSIQYIVEKELIAALRTYQAPSGSLIVMDPRTGAIMAMASYPSFDPNHFASTPADNMLNPATSMQYEPGSVFKMVTMAAGLDAGVVKPTTTIVDTGKMEVGGREIYDWDRAAHGKVDMTDVLAQSLNIGAATVAVNLGKERFYNYVRRFGFGRLTDIDLAEEVPGSLKLPGNSDWHESDLGANAFGQAIAVTPLQMIRSIAAIANRGLVMQPYVVGKIIDGDQVTEVKPTVVRRAISADTAETLTSMLVDALRRETQLALVPGYQIAGKTGTAEIPTAGGYMSDDTIASFIGYVPAHDARFIVLVKIDKPKASPWGSKVAAPVFRRVTEQVLNYLDIPPDNVTLASH
jgi:cell division protein FtsI/penicillin-binding protein 2